MRVFRVPLLGLVAASALSLLATLLSHSTEPLRSHPDFSKVDPHTEVRGADMGWPQCQAGTVGVARDGEGMPLPRPEAEYVMIGTTNGPSFTPNPCLAEQVNWARENDLWIAPYAVHSHPTAEQLEQYGEGPYGREVRYPKRRNAGWNAAQFVMAELDAADLAAPVLWIDIEPMSHKYRWRKDRAANAAVISGAVAAYRAAGYRIGFYSLPGFWKEIAGDLKFRAPEWRPAGTSGRVEARKRCAQSWSFQGGRGYFGQWLSDRRDHNITCPGLVSDMSVWFTR